MALVWRRKVRASLFSVLAGDGTHLLQRDPLLIGHCLDNLFPAHFGGLIALIPKAAKTGDVVNQGLDRLVIFALPSLFFEDHQFGQKSVDGHVHLGASCVAKVIDPGGDVWAADEFCCVSLPTCLGCQCGGPGAGPCRHHATKLLILRAFALDKETADLNQSRLSVNPAFVNLHDRKANLR